MRFLSFLIRSYQIIISPFLPHQCRFIPTCSDYALEASTVHGSLKGAVLSIKRVARCHPWNAGGMDRVPPSNPRENPCMAWGPPS